MGTGFKIEGATPGLLNSGPVGNGNKQIGKFNLPAASMPGKGKQGAKSYGAGAFKSTRVSKTATPNTVAADTKATGKSFKGYTARQVERGPRGAVGSKRYDDMSKPGALTSITKPTGFGKNRISPSAKAPRAHPLDGTRKIEDKGGDSFSQLMALMESVLGPVPSDIASLLRQRARGGVVEDENIPPPAQSFRGV